MRESVIAPVSLGVNQNMADILLSPPPKKRTHSQTQTSELYISVKCAKLEEAGETSSPQYEAQDAQTVTDLLALAEQKSTDKNPLKKLNFTRISPIKYQGPVLECQVAGYDSLAARAEVGDEREHDHIPSNAAVKAYLEKNLRRKLTYEESTLVKKRATAVEVHKHVHRQSRTYKGRNTRAQIQRDAENLRAAAEQDIKVLKENLMQQGISEEEIQKCIANIHSRNVLFGIYPDT
jgi:filamentous hemagglutinin